jgi:hypothetical protein
MIIKYDANFPWQIAKLIKDLRAEHLDAGGDPVDFPEWLANQGIRMVGFDMKVSDELHSFALLKYSR